MIIKIIIQDAFSEKFKYLNKFKYLYTNINLNVCVCVCVCVCVYLNSTE